MNKHERAYLEEVYNDCVKLKKHRSLTLYGEGMFDVSAILLKKKQKKTLRIREISD